MTKEIYMPRVRGPATHFPGQTWLRNKSRGC